MQFDLHVGGRCFKIMDPALFRKHTAEGNAFANGLHDLLRKVARMFQPQ